MLNIGFLLKQIKRHSDIFVLERAGDAKKMKWRGKKTATLFRVAVISNTMPTQKNSYILL